MEHVPRKKARTADDDGSVVIFIAPQKINKMRYGIMKAAALKKGFNIADSFSYTVTHLVTEISDIDQVVKNLGIDEQAWVRGHQIVNTKWFSESMKAGHPVDIQHDHRIEQIQTSNQPVLPEHKEITRFPDYACQRSTPLTHNNVKFTDALEILELHAELRNDQSVRDQTRALAFRRAAAVLKALPNQLHHPSDLRGLKGIGNHAEGVIKEILDHGYSSEVTEITASEQFKTLKLFDGVFGIGPSTANTWYSQGHRTIRDIVESTDVLRRNDKRVQYGLAFYEELNTPVPRCDAEMIKDYVTAEVNKILPGTTVELTGGFRRGKPSGHDIDLLISHPEEGKEQGLLSKLLKVLHENNLILFGRHENHVQNKSTSQNTMDDFEKWIGILKLPTKLKDCDDIVSLVPNTPDICSFDDVMSLAKSERTWMARRVDLVITPYSQYYYALVGWTGSKHFNRSLRLYAQREQNLKLTSHGLFVNGQIEGVVAENEKQVFENIKLQYREPWERNC